jgi:hypothetical protein
MTFLLAVTAGMMGFQDCLSDRFLKLPDQLKRPSAQRSDSQQEKSLYTEYGT